ncbi:MAG: flavodoxin domain-containing protein [Candidatus Woesearchaeota archaeon]
MEDKTVVVYKSKYGSTKKYAEWISEELNCDLYDRDKIKTDDLMKYDCIIYGGGVYATGIKGIDLIKKNFDKLIDKKVVIFSVGASFVNEKNYNTIKENSLSEKMKENVKFFMLRGGFNFKKLKFFDKILMKMMRSKIKKKDPKELTSEEKGLLDSYNNPVDFTNKRSIMPIIDYVKD